MESCNSPTTNMQLIRRPRAAQFGLRGGETCAELRPGFPTRRLFPSKSLACRRSGEGDPGYVQGPQTSPGLAPWTSWQSYHLTEEQARHGHRSGRQACFEKHPPDGSACFGKHLSGRQRALNKHLQDPVGPLSLLGLTVCWPVRQLCLEQAAWLHCSIRNQVTNRVCRHVMRG